MYKLNDIFYDDTEYPARAKFCNDNGYMIKEIIPDENGRRFQIVEVPQPTQKELDLEELEKLESWFDIDYARKEQKLRRLNTLGLQYEGQSAYDVLIATYVDAEKVRARINELRAKYGLS